MTETTVPVVNEKVDQLRRDFDAHETAQCDENVRMWKAIDELRNRLPNWAVLIISGLAAAVGWLISYAMQLVRVAT